jgi:hydrogenase maturation protease
MLHPTVRKRDSKSKLVVNRFPKTLILGVGNPTKCDDAVGNYVAEKLKNILNENGNLTIIETSANWLSLAELMIGYKRVILIDAIKTGGGKPGTIYVVSPEDLENASTATAFTTHDISFVQALQLLKTTYPKKLPAKIKIYAIEVEDTSRFTEKMTPKVKRTGDRVVKLIKDEIE